VLQHDGLGSFFSHTSCSKCGEHDGVFKCKDCGDGSMLKCLNCTLGVHQMLPLHCVEVSMPVTWCELVSWLCKQRWNGSFFKKATLQSLGLPYQLGHSGEPCPCPQAGPKNFVIFDISGLHHLTINYCQCRNKPLSSWFNYYERDGFQRRFCIHKQFSPSIALKCFMNSHYKRKPTCMTTIILSSDDPTIPTYPLQLYIKLPSFLCHPFWFQFSIDIPRFTVYFKCGGIWWPSNDLVMVTILEELLGHLKESWWSNVQLALILNRTFLTIGKRWGLCCEFHWLFSVCCL